MYSYVYTYMWMLEHRCFSKKVINARLPMLGCVVLCSTSVAHVYSVDGAEGS